MSGVGKKRNDIRFYTTIELKIMSENGSLSSKKKEEIVSDEKDDAENSTKYRTSSSETAFVSNSDFSNDFNQLFFNEQNNEENYIFTNKDIASKSISPAFTFFQCNEDFLKEKMPEGSNYKTKSKHYILKSKFKSEKKNKQDSNCNILKLEDIDLNKVDEILKDIEYVQDNININKNDNNKNKNKNKFDETDLNAVINEKINLDELSKIPIETFQNIDIDYSLCSCLNNYNFDCKYSYLFILLYS
jgi:hypothetical protein